MKRTGAVTICDHRAVARTAAGDVDAYLAGLPDERRELLAALRATILEHLPAGYVEAMTWGFPTYEVPLATYPDTYNGKPLMYCAFASGARAMSLYLMCVYAGSRQGAFAEAYAARVGKAPDMGKSCLRFRRAAELPLDLVAETVASTPVDVYVAHARAVRARP